MKTTTVLVVLLALIGMAVPVFGAESGANSGASSNGLITTGYSDAWTQADDYTDAGSSSYAIIGGANTASSSYGYGDVAHSDTNGAAVGIFAGSTSYGYAEDTDVDNTQSTAGAGSYAIGVATSSHGYSAGSTLSPSWAYADAGSDVFIGFATSGAVANTD